MLLCSPYKFFGPHLGLAFGRRELLERWRPYKVRPAPNEPVGHRFETGTLPHELLAGFVAAVEYVESIGWDAIRAHERALGERFLDGLPDDVHAVRPADDGRPRADVRVQRRRAGARRGRRAARRARLRRLARQLLRGRDDAAARPRRDGAVRAGIVHYNTPEEVDRLLAELARAVRLLVLGGTKFLGRHVVDGGARRGHEVTLFKRGRDEPGPLPRGRAAARRPRRRPRRARGPRVGRRRRHVRLRAAGRARVGRAARATRSGATCFVSSDLRLRGLRRAASTEDVAARRRSRTRRREERRRRDYGALKALCERGRRGRASASAALIVGPG